jgi:tetratricopeptide (TPR) repeat protein
MPGALHGLPEQKNRLSLTPGDQGSRIRLILSALGIVLLTVFVYLHAISNGFIWDDDDYVTANQLLRSAHGLFQIWFRPTILPQYYPLVHTSFWIEYHLWGLHPAGFHATNVLLHAANSLLLWALLRRLRVPGAWLAGALFGVHPVMVESVAWITERKNVLSGLFYFLSAMFYVRFALAENGRRRLADYAAALILFVCALLSKTVTCSLPAALLVITWWKRGRITRRDLLPLIPFFLAGIGFGIGTAVLEKVRVGATGKAWDLTLVERILIAGRALWFYVSKLVYPTRLTFIYPRWHISQTAPLQYSFPAAAIAVLCALFALRTRIGRGPAAAAFIFTGTLFPALGFINVYPMKFSFVADHFQYHASAALLALGAAGIAMAGHRIRAVPKVVLCAAPAALIALFSWQTWHQTLIYKDYATVWEDTLAKNPDSPIALTSVASVRTAQGRRPEAIALYRKTLKINPEDDVADFNLGKILLEEGQNEEAAKYLAESIRVSPDCSHCHYTYAVLLAQAGNLQEAVEHYKEALRTETDDPLIHYNYGVTLTQMNRTQDALHEFLEAIRLKPDLGAAYYGIRDSMVASDKAPQAEGILRGLQHKHPKVPEAYIALGDAIMIQHKPERFGEAAKLFAEALKLKPEWKEATDRLYALRQQGVVSQPE